MTQPPPEWGTMPPPPMPSPSMPPPRPGTGARGPSAPMNVAPPRYSHPVQGGLEPKSLAVAYVLWFFLGVIGIHHFYLGKTLRGVAYLFTMAWFTIGWWIDLFTLPAQVAQVNAQRYR